MSARRRAVRLTTDARADRDDILLYGLLSWGEAQMRDYESALDRAIQRLAVCPNLGRARDEVFPGCRSLVVEQHVIYYRADNDEIDISRILHQRQDVSGAVP